MLIKLQQSQSWGWTNPDENEKTAKDFSTFYGVHFGRHAYLCVDNLESVRNIYLTLSRPWSTDS